MEGPGAESGPWGGGGGYLKPKLWGLGLACHWALLTGTF